MFRSARPNRFRSALLALAVFLVGGCTGPVKVADPQSSLRDPALSPRVHLGAMQALDAEPTDERYLATLHRVVWLPGYTVDVREGAVARLERHDPEGLKRTIRQYLPRISGWLWVNRLCDIVAERGWVELTPALVSSWSQPSAAVDHEAERPEHRALARLHGAERVNDVVFELFVESDRVSDQGLRTRAWELLHRLGWRERLRGFIETGTWAEDDLFLHDLRTGLTELGVLPRNREEILWVRELCTPKHAAFRSLAREVTTSSDVHRREQVELRDLPIIVSALLHEPALLSTTRTALYDELQDYLRERKRYVTSSNFDNVNTGHRQRLGDFRNDLTWGDLAAMRIAIRALNMPQVVEHFFDYAERDRADTGTEYGGVMALDEQGRFELIEFMPRVRDHDERFNAPQAMLDAAYTSLFHFHFHAQRHRNEGFAGPGYGDINYADNLRANCLVLTFINEKTLNVDYYRHGRVVVDLGVITRE